MKHSECIVRSEKMHCGCFFDGGKCMKEKPAYFSKGEWALWCGSVSMILLFYFLFDGGDAFSLCASLIGVTSLIFNAKGHPFGQMLMIIFSLMYGVISWTFRYYGEMITYLGMTMPMALLALVSWLRNPFEKEKREVKVNEIGVKEWVFSILLTCAVTLWFYFILAYFNTSSLMISTLSVATSFMAACLTFRRSPYFALVYAMNDVVLIVLWMIAAQTDIRYISVIICFAAFLVNDLYGFINWQRMKIRQHKALND